jgi:hypothetical protein
MSLIASTLNHNRPFILGDLLISSNDVTKSIQLPTNTIDITEYLQNNSLLATGLYQKIYVIHSNVAIALAGVVSEMTKFLEEFKIRCSYYEPINETGIRKFIEDYELPKNFKNSAFFISLMLKEKESISVKQFWFPNEFWKTAKSELFEEVYACGSGKEDFLHLSSEEQTFEANSEKGDIKRAISANIGFIAKLLALERASLHNLKKNWGGGFENICFDGNSFIKIDQIAYISNHAQFDKEGNFDLPFPQLVQYYEYYNDVLLIISIEVKSWSRKEDNTNFILTSNNFQMNVFPVPSLDLKVESSIELPLDFSFSTNRLALGYAIISSTNTIFAPSFFIESKTMNATYQDGKNIEITIEKKMTEMIREGAKKAFPNL